MFNRITLDPNIMGGRACIRDMRIPVSVIVGQIAHGAAIEEVLNDYPDLEQEDIVQALAYTYVITHIPTGGHMVQSPRTCYAQWSSHQNQSSKSMCSDKT